MRSYCDMEQAFLPPRHYLQSPGISDARGLRGRSVVKDEVLAEAAAVMPECMEKMPRLDE